MAEQTTPIVGVVPMNTVVAARGRGGRLRGNGRSVSLSACGGVAANQRGFLPTGERLTCQICGKQGHPALDCYQRMNVAYKRRIPAKRLTAMAISPVTINKQPNGQWLLDTGANAHITPDLQNLINPKEYNGNENVGGVVPQDLEDAFPREM
ncbi:hypothetical protein ACFX2K_045595 [Malus domestica]